MTCNKIHEWNGLSSDNICLYSTTYKFLCCFVFYNGVSITCGAGQVSLKVNMYVLDYKIDKKLESIKKVLLQEFTQYIANKGINVTNRRKILMDNSVACFILNSYSVNFLGRDKFGLTLDEASYSNPNIVNGRDTKRKISYTYTKHLLNFLQDHAYIDLHKGGVKEYGMVNGKWGVLETENSFAIIQDKLRRLYDKNRVDLSSPIRENVIIMRINGIDMTFRMTPKAKIGREMTDRYNTLSTNFIVESEVGVHDVQTHKVYNDKKFETNGKNYMNGLGIQQLTKDQRKGIIISGEDTVVYDYSSFEPSIAYSLSGEVIPADPYSIELEGYDQKTLREIAKKCLLVMLNIKTKSYETLRMTCNSILQDEFDIPKLHREGKVPERIDVSTICDLVDQKNYLIRNWFYGQANEDTANIGSMICDYITDYFSQRGILVLSVFDEFIIQEQYEDELVKVMHNAYEFVCGSSRNCRISKEK